VPELRLQINTAIHRSTHEQPLYLLTGRHANFPVGLTNEAVFAENMNLKERLSEAHKAAVAASNESRSTYGKYYNRGKKENFQPDLGALVWYYELRKITGTIPPLSGRWRGPARVVARLGPVSFEVRDVHTDVQIKAHANHLKPFRTSHELSYESEDEPDEPYHDYPPEVADQESPMNMQLANVPDLPGVAVPELPNVADGKVDSSPPVRAGDADSQQGCSMTGARPRRYQLRSHGPISEPDNASA